MPTLAEIFNAIAARGGFRGTPISDLDVSEIDPEDLKAAFGNPNIQAQGARARALASQRDVNTLKDPQTYAFTAGMLGERPDQMGFSVLHPDYEKIIGRGEQGLVTGGVSMIGPTAQAIKGLVGAGGRGAMALGQAGARYADRVVPEILDRGGLGADILQDMATNTASNITQFKGFKNTTAFGKAKEVAKYLDSLDIPYTLNKSKTTNSAYLEVQTGKGDFDYPMQFRFSDHSTDLPHQNRQIFTNPKPDPNFDLDVFNGGGHDTYFAINKINELATKLRPNEAAPAVGLSEENRNKLKDMIK
jgi:hypothetical protein